RTSGSAPFDNARTGQRYPEAIGFRVRRRLTVIDRQPNVAVILQNGPNFLGRSGGKLFVVTGRRPAALASVTSFSSENGPPFIFSARSIRQNVTVDPSDRPPAYCCLSRSFRLSLPSLSVRLFVSAHPQKPPYRPPGRIPSFCEPSCRCGSMPSSLVGLKTDIQRARSLMNSSSFGLIRE
ncbi:unnamed protein product, partial [Nesidiocoris tenuis]